MTFLSIDCDYWNHTLGKYETRAKQLAKYLAEVTKIARRKHIPISCVMNHQQMLSKVNASKARTLINLDTHSDLADISVGELNCGTWVSYVRWRHEGTYHWIHAGDVGAGECNGVECIFDHDGLEPRGFLSDWKLLKETERRTPPKAKTLMENCCEVCVCMSPAYSNTELITVFKEWRKQFSIPYMKGLCTEMHGRKFPLPNRIITQAQKDMYEQVFGIERSSYSSDRRDRSVWGQVVDSL